MRFAIHIRAHVQQDRSRPRSSRKNRRQRRPVKAVQSAQHHLGRSHRGAGVAGRNEACRSSLANQAQPYPHGGVALGAHRLHRLIFHGNDFAGVNDLEGQSRRRRMTVKFRLDRGFRADQQHAHAVIARGMDRAFDFRLGSPIRAHRIQRNHARHGGRKLAGFLHFHNFAAFVVAALDASAMRHLLLVAVRTLRERMALERIVRPPGRGPLLRMSSFRIRHGL